MLSLPSCEIGTAHVNTFERIDTAGHHTLLRGDGVSRRLFQTPRYSLKPSGLTRVSIAWVPEDVFSIVLEHHSYFLDRGHWPHDAPFPAFHGHYDAAWLGTGVHSDISIVGSSSFVAVCVVSSVALCVCTATPFGTAEAAGSPKLVTLPSSSLDSTP